MPVPTLWTIDHHPCGHRVEHDLSGRAADRRAGLARWLSGRACPDCWRAADTGTRDTKAWLAAKRREELEAAEAWARRYEMPVLEGPEKALSWGERCRHQLVGAAYTALVAEGELDDADWSEVEEQVRTVTRAGWWIDQRETAGADLPELLAAATDADRPTENPYV